MNALEEFHEWAWSMHGYVWRIAMPMHYTKLKHALKPPPWKEKVVFMLYFENPSHRVKLNRGVARWRARWFI